MKIEGRYYEANYQWGMNQLPGQAALISMEVMAKRMKMKLENWPYQQMEAAGTLPVIIEPDETVKDGIGENLIPESVYILYVISKKLSRSVAMRNRIKLHVSDEYKTVKEVDESFEELFSELEEVIERLTEIRRENHINHIPCDFIGELLEALIGLRDSMQNYNEKTYYQNASEIESRAKNVLMVERQRPCNTCENNCGVPELNEKRIIPLIKKIRNKVTFRAGEYLDYGEVKTITLFRSILGNFQKHYEEWFSTFAHELFHAYHYESCDLSKRIRGEEHEDIVIESLASYFGMKYCENAGFPIIVQNGTDRLRFINCANELSDEWSGEEMDDWPYAGAQYIESDDVFKKVFDVTRSDMKEAYYWIVYYMMARKIQP